MILLCWKCITDIWGNTIYESKCSRAIRLAFWIINEIPCTDYVVECYWYCFMMLSSLILLDVISLLQPVTAIFTPTSAFLVAVCTKIQAKSLVACA